MEALGLYVEVPVASFRVPQARELFETFPVPPPSTVYGMLLSYVGEPLRATHAGARIATALLSEPTKSVVLRKMRRFKKPNWAAEENARPDFQELLVDVRLAVWVCAGDAEGLGEERPKAPLVNRLRRALDDSARVERFGGLSLGESAHLVNEVRPLREGDLLNARLVKPDPRGRLTLPIWPDHVGSANTRWGRYELVELSKGPPPKEAFETIAPLKSA